MMQSMTYSYLGCLPMLQLYRWFLNQVRLGVNLIDSLAKAAIRWAEYPATQIWNAGVAAFSSRAVASYMDANPYASFASILNGATGYIPKYGTSYSQEELINAFPTFVRNPYTATAIVLTGSETTGNYQTASVPLQTSWSWDEIAKRIDEQMQRRLSPNDDSQRKFIVTFIAGIPQLVEVGL